MRRRLPWPRVARTGTVWAILAGLGANALVGAVLRGLVGIVLSFTDVPRDWQAFPAVREGLIIFAGGAVGAAVALRSGGWRALLGFAGTLAAFDVINGAIAAPGLRFFCERGGGAAQSEFCVDRGLLEQLVTRWPLIVGVATGLLLAQRFRSGRGGTNSPIEAIGVVFIGEEVARVAPAPFLPPPGDALTPAYWVITSALYLAVALVGGHVLVRRGARPWPISLILAVLFFVAPWVPSLVSYVKYPLGAPPAEYAWLAVSPAGYALAFLLGAILTAAFARPRPPDADAARRGAR